MSTQEQKPEPKSTAKPETKQIDGALGDIELDRVVGGTTSGLFALCCTGKHVPTATVTP